MHHVEIQGTEAYPEDAVLLLGDVPVLQACRHVEQDERGRRGNDRSIQERIPQGRHRMQGYI